MFPLSEYYSGVVKYLSPPRVPLKFRVARSSQDASRERKRHGDGRREIETVDPGRRATVDPAVLAACQSLGLIYDVPR